MKYKIVLNIKFTLFSTFSRNKKYIKLVRIMNKGILQRLNIITF